MMQQSRRTACSAAWSSAWINIPTALSLAVSMSLVPAISSAWAVQDMDAVQRQTNLGLRFAFLIGLPCSVGMSVLSEQIFRFFYQGR